MSQSSDSTDQDIFELARTTFTYNCLTYAFVALPLYEYLVTWDQEFELVWRKKTRFSVPSMLLVSTRFCMVAAAILAVMPSPTCTSLKALYSLQDIIDAAGYIQVALFSALRVSALYNRNGTLFAIIFVLGLVPVGTNIVNAAHTIYIQEPGECIQDTTIPDALVPKIVLVSRIPIIFADSVVLILTWAKTYQQILLSRGIKVSATLSTCIARDGALYFLALLTINILQIATYRSHLGTPISIILPVLPPILISRFMINLQQVCNPTDTRNVENSVVSTLRFQLSEQVVGSMGAPLDHVGARRSGDTEVETYRGDILVDSHDFQDRPESYDISAVGVSAAASA